MRGVGLDGVDVQGLGGDLGGGGLGNVRRGTEGKDQGYTGGRVSPVVDDRVGTPASRSDTRGSLP